MIVKDERIALVDLLQKVLDGDLSANAYLAFNGDKRKDHAVSEIWSNLVDLLVDDLALNRPIVLGDTQPAILQRCVLFLGSTYEYQWPPYPDPYNPIMLSLVLLTGIDLTIAWIVSAIRLIVAILVAHGAFFAIVMWLDARGYKKAVDRWSSFGEWQVWPFTSLSQLEDARRSFEARR